MFDTLVCDAAEWIDSDDTLFRGSCLPSNNRDTGGKWGVVHFWRRGVIFAQIAALRMPLHSSPPSAYFLSPRSREGRACFAG
jgi:hypothetical protein